MLEIVLPTMKKSLTGRSMSVAEMNYVIPLVKSLLLHERGRKQL